MVCSEKVESVEELLLALLSLLKKLYIVHQQNVYVSVLSLERLHALLLKCVYIFIEERLCSEIAHRQHRVLAPYLVAYRLHQVCLAKSRSAVYEKRIVVFLTRIVGDTHRGGERPAV